MRCKVAATFGRLPSEIAALPMSEFRMMRDYVLALDEEMREAHAPKDIDDPETWGNEAVANAPWQTEVVTAME